MTKRAQATREPGTGVPDTLRIVPPHDVQVEQALIGSCLRKFERLDDVVHVLAPEDFYSPVHRVLFSTLIGLVEQFGHADIVSLASALHASGRLDEVGGSTYLAGLANGVPGNVVHWAGIVRDLSRRRLAMEVALRVYEAAQDRAVDVQEVAVASADLVDRVLADKLDTGRQTPAQIVADHRDWIDMTMDESVGVPFPYPRLQDLTGGLLPGEVAVLAARPSNGKTALALNLCVGALRHGLKVGIVSLEMRSRSLMDRLCAMTQTIDAQRFRSRTLTPEDRQKILGFHERFKAAPVRMWDEPEFSPARMRSVAKQWKRQMGGLDLLMVDYLQLLGSDRVDGRMSYNREQEVARISKAVKRLALGEEVPVILLCQLNRSAEKDKKPMLSHLRESGSLEQDADMVLFLSFWDPREPADEVQLDLDVAKSRSSRTGTVPVTFHRRYLRFEPRMEGGW